MSDYSPQKIIAKRHQQQQLLDLSAFTNDSSGDLINLSLGDPDFNTPQAIIAAAFADAENGHTHYTNGLGQIELREAVCKDLGEFNMHVGVDKCMITTSACHAMWLTLEAILDDGDEVIIFSPYFSPYVDQIQLARGVAVDCPAAADFSIDIEKFQACITDKTKAIIINSPNNPSGHCYDEANLLQVAELAKQHDLTVIADDIYTAFCYQQPHVAMAALPEMSERTITLGSFSKNYCMTGWRIGYVIAPEPIIKVMESINQSVIFSPPSISQRAALYALKHKADFQPQIVEDIRQRAFFAYEQLNQLQGVSCAKPAGGMYVFPNISDTGMTAQELTDYWLKAANVRVIAGDTFGKGGEGHIRIALTVPIPQMAEAFERIAKISLF